MAKHHTTPGHCAAWTSRAPLRSDPDCPVDAHLGWEVELPVITRDRTFSSIEKIATTTFPSGLARVMGEAEYLEQVEELNEMIERQHRRTWRWRAAVPVAYVTLYCLATLLTLGALVLMLVSPGIVAEWAILIGLLFLFFCFSTSPVCIAAVIYSIILAKRHARENSQEILDLTARWGHRGIAWRFKQSEPSVGLEGKHNTVVAKYTQRVTVECAPSAIDLFEQQGPFPVSSGFDSASLEAYGTFVAKEGRGRVARSPRMLGDCSRFSLPYADVADNKDPWLQPTMPLMLVNVMGKGEYAEQVAVVNKALLKSTRTTRMCRRLALASMVATIPAYFLSMLSMIVAGYAGAGEDLGLLLGLGILLAPLAVAVLFLALEWHYRSINSDEMQTVLDAESQKWANRGLELCCPEEAFTLSFGQKSTEVTDRRATIRIKPNAFAQFQALGPFNPGEIDGAVCQEYQLASF